MKIALFSEVYVPQINGVVTHVKILKAGLEQLGHEVMVVTADANATRHYVDADHVLHCPAHTSKKFYGYGLAIPFSQRRLKLVREFHPDIIHVHTEFGVGLSGVAFAKLLHVPLVYTLHTMYDDYIYYVAPKALAPAATKLSRKYTKMLAKRANAITGPSLKCSEYFKSSGFYEKEVNVIPNAVETEEFSPKNISAETKAALRLKHGIPPDDMVCIFVGRLGREKSCDVLLDYWAKCVSPGDHMHLVIIGGGPIQEELEAQARQLGIEGMVTFTGKVPHEELPPYYAISDVYVTASLSDTNSISMLEGMCSGLPVLQRTDPLNADQVLDGQNGYNFNSAEEMVEKLRQIQTMDPDTLAKFKESVIESIRNSGARDLASHTLAVYEKILKK